MNQYYKNAFCVIAATMSEDVTKGFLMPNVADPLSSKLAPADDVRPPADLKHQIPFFGRDGEAGYLILETNPTFYSAGIAPLNRRCWALQERLLCPRILQFTTSSSFSLQCNFAERFAGHITPDHNEISESHHLIQPNGLDGSNQRSDGTSWVLHDSWLRIVSAYATMAVSDPSDYLMAIAALAEEYHYWYPALGGYLAGHWAGRLHYSLD